MRLLIVEDDSETGISLKNSFQAEGYVVDIVQDGEKGSYVSRTNEYDLIILDYNLPKKNGLDICRDIRKAGKMMPIILLSVKSELPDKVALLNAGADDYVTKPFSFTELLARVRAILRRPKIIKEKILAVADLSLDKNKQTAVRGKKQIYLTRKEFLLLEYLMANKGDFISRGSLMEHVWDSSLDPFSNTIETHIMNLRKKIDGSKQKKLIHTIPGRGYKIDEL